MSVADLMLDGTLCQHCGIFMEDGDIPGYPRSCDSCKGNDNNECRPVIKRYKKKDSTKSYSTR